ncbi:helix-hairpin-helix domain-containing protein [Arthrobacter sp. RHLT1-20]
MAPKSVEPGRTPLPRGIAAPARRALAHEGVETLEQMVELGGQRLSGLHGMGPGTLAQLQDALDEHGLELPRY